MQQAFAKHVSILAAGALFALSAQAFAASGSDGATGHDHEHSEEHAHDHGDDDIYNGYFDDELLSLYNVVNMGFRFVPPNSTLMRSYWQASVRKYVGVRSWAGAASRSCVA